MREMQVRRKWLAFSVRDLQGSLSHSETSYAVTITKSDASLSGSTITIHGRLLFRLWIMNRPSTTLGSNAVARSSIAVLRNNISPIHARIAWLKPPKAAADLLNRRLELTIETDGPWRGARAFMSTDVHHTISTSRAADALMLFRRSNWSDSRQRLQSGLCLGFANSLPLAVGAMVFEVRQIGVLRREQPVLLGLGLRP